MIRVKPVPLICRQTVCKYQSFVDRRPGEVFKRKHFAIICPLQRRCRIDNDKVFNADPKLTFPIVAWLVGKYHAWLQGDVTHTANPLGTFMH